MQQVPQRVGPPSKRMAQLTQDTIGDRFVHTVGLRSSVLGHEVGAKQLIPEGKECRIICPYGIPFICVVPVMKFRCDDEPMQPLKPPPHISVKEQPQNELSHCESPGELEGKSSSDQEKEGRCENGAVKGMSTKPAGPIQMLGGMMN